MRNANESEWTQTMSLPDFEYVVLSWPITITSKNDFVAGSAIKRE